MTQTQRRPAPTRTGPHHSTADERLVDERTADDRPLSVRLLAAALDYAARGWRVHPLRPREKTPLLDAWPHRATTDAADIARWWSRWPEANIAVCTGAPAFDVVDVDIKPDGSGWPAFNAAKRAGLLAGATAIVRTPAGGVHLHFPGTEQRNGRQSVQRLDFRGAGGYVVMPPSRIPGDHPSYRHLPYVEWRHYEWVDRRGEGRPVDWAAIVALLDPPKPAPQRKPRPAMPAGYVSPGDDFDARAEWADILTPHGWRYMYSRGQVDYWCRPGKERGVSATVNAMGTDRLRVFTTSTDLDADSYSKFGAYAALNHGGDHRAAAAELRKAGYGAAGGGR